MSISEPVLEMIKRIKDGKASFTTREDAWGLYYIIFDGVPHPEIWVVPQIKETNQPWMTKEEKEALCQKVEDRMEQLRQLELIKGRENWKELFGID